MLSLRSETSGVVVTPRLYDRIGTLLPAGTMLVEVDDVSTLRARIYIPEFDTRELRSGQPVSLLTNSDFGLLHSELEGFLPQPASASDPLLPQQEFRGARLPSFYIATALVSNQAGRLRAGETGSARVFIKRRSIWEMARKRTYDFIRSKIW